MLSWRKRPRHGEQSVSPAGHDADRLVRGQRDSARGEQRIIRHDGANADQDRIMGGAQLMRPGT